jgi:hypothetical protein
VKSGPPIIQYWDSEEVPDYVAATVASFAELNPDLTHRLFDRREAGGLIAERFGARHAAAFAACAVPAMQADYFRYCAAFALGGVYVDVDFSCRASLRPLLDDAATGTLFGRAELPSPWRTPAFEWREPVGAYRVVMNSLFAFPSPGHPLLELAIEIATANIEGRVAEDVALVTGPAIFTSLYQLNELDSFDAFVAYLRGSAMEASARLLCETVGEHARVQRAFEGVRVLAEEETGRWVAASEAPLPYKATERHWTNVTSSIYT